MSDLFWLFGLKISTHPSLIICSCGTRSGLAERGWWGGRIWSSEWNGEVREVGKKYFLYLFTVWNVRTKPLLKLDRSQVQVSNCTNLTVFSYRKQKSPNELKLKGKKWWFWNVLTQVYKTANKQIKTEMDCMHDIFQCPSRHKLPFSFPQPCILTFFSWPRNGNGKFINWFWHTYYNI